MISAYIKRLPLSVRHTFHYDLRAAMLFGVFGGFFFPFMHIVGRKIGATDTEIALISAAPYISNAFALLWAEDIFGKGRVWYVVWPNALGRAVLLGMFFIAAPVSYTVLIFIYMVVTSIAFPSYAYIMKANYPDNLRAALMSYVRIATALLWIASSALGGWFLEKDTFNFRYIFPLAGVFGVLSALQFGKIRVRREKVRRVMPLPFKALSLPLRDKPFLFFVLAYSLFEFALLLAMPVYQLVLVDEAGISNMAAGIYGSVFSGMWLIGFFLWGRFLDGLELKWSVAAISLTGCVIPLIYLLSRNIWALGAAAGVAGFLFASTELAAYIVITRLASHEDVPRYMAAAIAIGALRGATAPFIGTAIYSSIGPSPVFALSLLTGLLAAGVSLRIRKESLKKP